MGSVADGVPADAREGTVPDDERGFLVVVDRPDDYGTWSTNTAIVDAAARRTPKVTSSGGPW